MITYNDYSAVKTIKPLCLAIGTFDGLHLGHQALIAAALNNAGNLGYSGGVMTFDPHPATLAGKQPELLMTLEQRIAALEKAGCDMVIVQNLKNNFGDLEPEAFISQVLLPLQVKEIHIGRGFTFGKDRRGTIETLKTLGARYGLNVHETATVSLDGDISSSRIRSLLKSGQLEMANKLLGYNYTLSGRVVTGAQRGRQLGFPTANIATGQLLPAGGVYGGVLYLDGTPYIAATHVGPPTTFNATIPTVEAYLPDYHGPAFYGSQVTLELSSFIRPTRQFSGPQAIIEQMNSDVAQILAGT